MLSKIKELCKKIIEPWFIGLVCVLLFLGIAFGVNPFDNTQGDLVRTIEERYNRKFDVVGSWYTSYTEREDGYEPTVKWRNAYAFSPRDDKTWAFEVSCEKDGSKIRENYEFKFIAHIFDLEVNEALLAEGLEANTLSTFTYGMSAEPGSPIDNVAEYLNLKPDVADGVVAIDIIVSNKKHNSKFTADRFTSVLEDISMKYNIVLSGEFAIVDSKVFGKLRETAARNTLFRVDKIFREDYIDNNDIVLEEKFRVEKGSFLYNRTRDIDWYRTAFQAVK